MPVLKHRLVAGIVLTLFVTGCAAGRAFRRGDDAARAGDWDAAVVQYTKAVQERPEKAEYKTEEHCDQSANKRDSYRSQIE